MKNLFILTLLLLNMSIGFAFEGEGRLPRGKECMGEDDPICIDIDLSEIRDRLEGPSVSENRVSDDLVREGGRRTRDRSSTQEVRSHRGRAGNDV